MQAVSSIMPSRQGDIPENKDLLPEFRMEKIKGSCRPVKGGSV
jgi:hypothetical protein